MVKNYDHWLTFSANERWALLPEVMDVIADIMARRGDGDMDRDVIAANLVNRKNLPQPRAGSVAIIPVYGVISSRANWLSELFDGTTFDKLTGQLRQAAQTRDIKTIVFDINSPGGSVAGATEFAAEVRKARKTKAVIAQAQYTMASAALWPFAGATEIVGAPSASIGGLGVYTVHTDRSSARAQNGEKLTYVFAGEGKVDGNDAGPLSDEASAKLQKSVNQAYDQMVADVVKGRGQGTTPEKVRNEWKAHVYGADEAKSLGLIDRIGTLDDTLARILSASSDAADQRAALAFMHTTELAAEAPTGLSDLDLERALFELTL